MDLQSWLRRERHWIPAGDPTKATHVFLDGGKAAVPASAVDAMHAAYARDVAAGRRLHAVERTIVGGTYRMFADFDVQMDADDGGERLRSILYRAIALLPTPMRQGEVVVCTRSYHAGKTGAHLIWGDGCRVDDRAASAMRDEWAAALTRQQEELGIGDDIVVVDWENTVDASVYRRNGLRMPWSHKVGGVQRAAYAPTHVVRMDEDGVPRMAAISPAVDPRSEAEVRHWIGRTSVAAAAGEAGHDDAGGGETVVTSKRRRRRVVVVEGGGPVGGCSDEECDGEDDTEACGGGGDDESKLSPAERTTLLAALPAALYGNCKLGTTCRPRSMPRTAGGAGGITVSCSSRYCQAVGREHGSNHVYFDFLPPSPSDPPSRIQIVQRCHKCADARIVMPASTPDAAAAVARLLRKRALDAKKKKQKRAVSLTPATPAGAAAFWLARLPT